MIFTIGLTSVIQASKGPLPSGCGRTSTPVPSGFSPWHAVILPLRTQRRPIIEPTSGGPPVSHRRLPLGKLAKHAALARAPPSRPQTFLRGARTNPARFPPLRLLNWPRGSPFAQRFKCHAADNVVPSWGSYLQPPSSSGACTFWPGVGCAPSNRPTSGFFRQSGERACSSTHQGTGWKGAVSKPTPSIGQIQQRTPTWGAVRKRTMKQSIIENDACACGCQSLLRFLPMTNPGPQVGVGLIRCLEAFGQHM